MMVTRGTVTYVSTRTLSEEASASMATDFMLSRCMVPLTLRPQLPAVVDALPQKERGREATSVVGRAATSMPAERSKLSIVLDVDQLMVGSRPSVGVG